jgi:hypothetical protein
MKKLSEVQFNLGKYEIKIKGTTLAVFEYSLKGDKLKKKLLYTNLTNKPKGV